MFIKKPVRFGPDQVHVVMISHTPTTCFVTKNEKEMKDTKGLIRMDGLNQWEVESNIKSIDPPKSRLSTMDRPNCWKDSSNRKSIDPPKPPRRMR
jgi:hypothetical protein